MTDQLKIVRIHARNVPHVHGHKCLNNDASRISVSLQENDSIVFSMCWGSVLLKHKKTRPETMHISGSGL